MSFEAQLRGLLHQLNALLEEGNASAETADSSALGKCHTKNSFFAGHGCLTPCTGGLIRVGGNAFIYVSNCCCYFFFLVPCSCCVLFAGKKYCIGHSLPFLSRPSFFIPPPTVQDIRQIIMQPGLKASSRALCTDFLVTSQQPPSLIAFVDRASYQQFAKNKNLAKARIEGTELARDYMEQYQTSIEGLENIIQKTFYSVFKRDEKNPVRVATFDVFEALLNIDDGIPPPPPSTMNM
jgi:hypothetical protein